MGARREPEHAPRIAVAREREAMALEMRKGGATFFSIAMALGITEMGASKAVRRALARLNANIAENVEEVRRLECERLDQALEALYPKVLRGDISAVETFIKISKRRSELMGADAPKQIEHSGEIGIRQYEGVPVEEV